MRKRLANLDVGNQVVEKGPLAAQRFERPVRFDSPVIDSARQIVQPCSAVAEMRRQPCHLLRRKVGPRKNTQPFHLRRGHRTDPVEAADRRSEEHTSELQSIMRSSYAVFCLKKKNQKL